MCSALVAMKVWMRLRAAGCSASAARSMSAALARASEQTTLFLIFFGDLVDAPENRPPRRSRSRPR